MSEAKTQRHRPVSGVYLFVLALLLLGRLVSPTFWTAGSLLQVVQDVSILGVVAVGLAFITYSGHFVDLSIPAIMAVSGIVAVALLPYGYSLALAAGLLSGLLLGLVNGLVVGYLRLNPILWTLAALSLIDGITRWAYGGQWIYADETTLAGTRFVGIYRASVLGVPAIVLVFAAVAIVGGLLMRHSGWGRNLKLVGAAYEPARMSGVPVRRTVCIAFVLSGLTSALAGLIKTSLNKYGDVEIGLGYDFLALTAVVLGGTPLAGGRGTMAGVVGGALVMGLLGSILPLIPGIGQDQQSMIRGVIFVVVVGLSQWALRRRGRDDQ
ncbi:MAG: ABC transporter permease [Armatimonadetes bacterium]|nr:ABC transporter permease [Armatimonadota bacterium]